MDLNGAPRLTATATTAAPRHMTSFKRQGTVVDQQGTEPSLTVPGLTG